MAGKSKRTRVRALEGRIVESVTICGSDYAEGDSEYFGPSLEIRVSGGYVFTFTAAPEPAATTTLGIDRKGNLDLGESRRWK